MRVCHIVEATAGGSARIVAQLVHGQITQGDEVTLIYSPLRADAPFLKALDAIRNIHIIPLPMHRAIGLHDLFTAIRLFRLLRSLKPFDVIHSHCSKAGALSRFVGLFMPAVQIYTPHGFFSMTPGAPKIFALIERFLSFITDAIVTVSPIEERRARDEIGIASKKINLILNGIHLDYNSDPVAARRLCGFSGDVYIVGFVGRLVRIKNPMRLMETFRLLTMQNFNIVLVVVGSGDFQIEMEAYLSQHQLQNKVHFMAGYDARDIIPGFDCLLCTSDQESFGLVAVEAINAGVPVVTTPVGISESAVVNAKTGFIADFTPEDLAKNVLKLADLGSADRKQMAINCKTMAQKFDVETMIERNRSLYQRLIKQKESK